MAARTGLTPACPFSGVFVPSCCPSITPPRGRCFSLQPGSHFCSQKPAFGAQSISEHTGRAAAGHRATVEPGQGWHHRSKATPSLQTSTSSAPTCFAAPSQAPASYCQKGDVSPNPTLRLLVGPQGIQSRGIACILLVLMPQGKASVS